MMKMMQLPLWKMKKTMTSRATTALTTLSLILVPMAVAALAPAAHAQSFYAQQSVRRTVEGTVRDRNDALLKGAVVYLKDSRTLAVKSFLSDDQGYFHFGQLSQNADYEVYAEFGGKRSKVRNISSFDSKNDFTIVLKIDTAA